MIKDLIAQKEYLTDKFTSHSYLDTYEQVFATKKYTALNVLEVGVSKGGSILLWRDYFPNATIYGLDVDDMPPAIVNDSKERINIFKADAYNKQFIIDNFINKGIRFDVLIDDGPHTFETMSFFVEHYSKVMAPGAVMIIEDIGIIEWPEQLAAFLPANLKSKAKKVDLRHIKDRWDDVMLVVET
jgi:cephalosporin hydroxylase